MRTKYENSIKPSAITQELINKIEELYLKTAYGENIDKYTWNRAVGTTISLKEIIDCLHNELEKEKSSFLEFEANLYKEKYGVEADINKLYFDIRNEYLNIDNKYLSYHMNPCYGAYVEGMINPDIHLKIKYIVSNGEFYVYLENSEWNGRGVDLDNKTLRAWDNMIINLYYHWFINDIPVHIPNQYRTKVKRLLNK